MFYSCPKDASHQSADSDYCSVCGAKIAGSSEVHMAFNESLPAAAATPAQPAAASSACPDCGTPRRDGARFCEICRYNFDTRTSAAPDAIAFSPQTAAPPSTESVPADRSESAAIPDAPLLSPPLPDAAKEHPSAEANPPRILSESVPVLSSPSIIPSPVQSAAGTGAIQWEVIITVDPSLYLVPDPEVTCPVNEPERVFPIDLLDNLIGRRSPRQDIFPQIPLSDPGISHRHAKIQRQSDGSLILLDIGSTNGTQLNGQDVQPGVRTPLQDGDQITLGFWTRITLQGQQAKR